MCRGRLHPAKALILGLSSSYLIEPYQATIQIDVDFYELTGGCNSVVLKSRG